MVKMAAALLVVAMAAAVAAAAVAAAPLPKRLAGEPSEFALHRMPSEAELAETSAAAVYNVALRGGAGEQRGVATFAVDSETHLVVALLSPQLGALARVALVTPSGDAPPASSCVRRDNDTLPLSDGASEAARGVAFACEAPARGEWRIDVTTTSRATAHAAVLLVRNDAPAELAVERAAPADGPPRRRVPVALRAHFGGHDAFEVRSGALLVTAPNGTVTHVDMELHDAPSAAAAGGHRVVAAARGAFVPAISGTHTVRTTLRGVRRPSGVAFVRTHDELVHVVDDATQLDAERAALARVVQLNDSRTVLRIALPLSDDDATDARRYLAYAELFGTPPPPRVSRRGHIAAAGGRHQHMGAAAAPLAKRAELATPPAHDGDVGMRAVAWLGGMAAESRDAHGRRELELELDARWLARAAVDPSGALELRNVRVQQAVDGVVLSVRARVEVAFAADTMARAHEAMADALHAALASAAATDARVFDEPAAAAAAVPIDAAMRRGTPPAHVVRAAAAVASGASEHSTVLVHGYCADYNPFAPHQALFKNSLVFMSADRNMPNDVFAAQIDAFLRGKGVHAAVAVAHSQGGKASLHLKNFYWSALDAAEAALSDDARVVQTVGTPWLGNSAMATLGGIGKVFGVTCGVNRDLTTKGARKWLAGIAAESRAAAYFYTTTYRLGRTLGDWCSLGVNAILKWPNDGASELKLAQLPGGNSMGNVERQCHTRNMAYESQCDDKERNVAMNAYAQPNA